jgi:hypothetical protein
MKKHIIVDIPDIENLGERVQELESNRVKPKSKRDIEIEQNKKYWDQYYKDNQGKIANKLPKSIFDNDNTEA